MIKHHWLVAMSLIVLGGAQPDEHDGAEPGSSVCLPCQRCDISYSLSVTRGTHAQCFQIVETGTTYDPQNLTFKGQCMMESPPCPALTCAAITVDYDITWNTGAGCAAAGTTALLSRVDGGGGQIVAGGAPVAVRVSTGGANCGGSSTRTFEIGAVYTKETPQFIISTLVQWELISHCAGACPF